MSEHLRDSKYDFHRFIKNGSLDLSPLSVTTLQVNVTKLCNQACVHCHVDSSPKRTEQISIGSVNKCLQVLKNNECIKNLDLTGGAPELNPHFDYFVTEARKLNKHVMVRHNLTVTIDGNPVTGENKAYIPEFFAENRVEVIASLPYYQEYFTDKQRGKGVFEKSIESISMLNKLGYGVEKTGLVLNFVYNPVGAFLPADQNDLEKDFRRELESKYGIKFNNLFTIVNMPINRFKDQLQTLGAYEDYMNKLMDAFNPVAAEGIMCRNMISVGYDGKVYDCDFNQMLNMQTHAGDQPLTIYNLDLNKFLKRKIKFASHCFGCTAGPGSSCGGSIT